MRGEVFPTNRKNTIYIIAPLKKAQRKSEGGQLFPGSVFPLRATPFPKTPQNPPTPLFFKGVSVILLFTLYFPFALFNLYAKTNPAYAQYDVQNPLSLTLNMTCFFTRHKKRNGELCGFFKYPHAKGGHVVARDSVRQRQRLFHYVIRQGLGIHSLFRS